MSAAAGWKKGAPRWRPPPAPAVVVEWASGVWLAASPRLPASARHTPRAADRPLDAAESAVYGLPWARRPWGRAAGRLLAVTGGRGAGRKAGAREGRAGR
jgi:hypothetical protein